MKLAAVLKVFKVGYFAVSLAIPTSRATRVFGLWTFVQASLGPAPSETIYLEF
jgi:hypothetical protein